MSITSLPSPNGIAKPPSSIPCPLRRSECKQRSSPSIHHILPLHLLFKSQNHHLSFRSSEKRVIQCGWTKVGKMTYQDHDLWWHRPTKWNLYRSLLRAATPPAALSSSSTAASSSSRSVLRPESGQDSYPCIRRNVQHRWRRFRAQTSLLRSQKFLEKEYMLLSHLHYPTPESLSHLIQLESKFQSREQALEAERIAKENSKPFRPRLKGSFLYPTYFNPPMPRLSPQPVHISMMISKRIKSREKRIAKSRLYTELMRDMSHEVNFWRQLGVVGTKDGSNESQSEWTRGDWNTETKLMLEQMQESFQKEKARSEMIFTEEVVEKVLEAKRRRRAWRMEQAKKRKEAKKECAITKMEATQEKKSKE